MNHKVEVCEPGGAWHELHARRRYTLMAAFFAFDREVLKGTRGVRILDGQGKQVAVFQPGRVAA